MAIFDKTDFWGLKYPLEMRLQHEKCSTIYGTPVQAILDPKDLTRLAGGVREGQNMARKRPIFGGIFEEKVTNIAPWCCFIMSSIHFVDL